MRNVILLLIAISMAVTAGAQNDGKIVIGKIDSVYSTILGEKRKVWIYTPEMTALEYDPAKRYPVLYLLDGDAHFPSVVGLVQQLSQVNGNTVFPEMIVVAIPNTDRTRDLTPTHITSDLPAMDSMSARTTGGGEKFIAFMEKELMPHIDSTYPTAPYRVLVGHSFGGLIVMLALTNHTKLFNAYLAIDPSMWYDRQRFLAATKARLTEKKYGGRRLFVGIANTLPDGMTFAKMTKDTSEATRHIRSIFELDKFLKATPQNALTYASRYYNDDNHGSVPLASEYDGLRSLFNYYRFNLTGKDFYDSSAALVAKFEKHYQLASRELGYPVYPQELFINYLGYDALSKNHFRKAAALFQMNVANYPKSSNVYDSYADLLATQKDTVNAIVYYKKALALKDNPATKQKLAALQSKEAFRLAEADLQQYTGVFDFEGFPLSATLQVKAGVLWASVPGQDDSELVPLSADTFTVKNKSGYIVQFSKADGKVLGFTAVQPNGTFKARVKQ